MRMGKYGRERVEKTLAWHHEKTKLLEAYSSLAELRRPRSGSLAGINRLLFGRTRQWHQHL
jgi:hypothetical protein